jgi:tripartite-type tricarboxylate transporter receptor subunit TctC
MRGLLRALLCLNLAACVLAPTTLMSQAYPSKPIRLVVPYPPGSSSVDIIGRIVATKMSEALGQTVVIDNRAGANGTIGSEYVARAAPDGYTVLFGTSSSHVISMFVSKTVPYDAVRDFTPVTMAGSALTGLVANPSFPVNSVKELVAFAKKNPGKVSYASNGVGSIYHLCGELLNLLTGTDMVHVPYKGGAQLLPDVMSGQVPVTFASLISVLPHVKSGKLKLLAVLEPTRYEIGRASCRERV